MLSNPHHFTTSDYEHLISEALGIADEAGRAIMHIYAQQVIDVTRKNDHSPVTEADYAAHRVIVPALQKLTPHIPVISEESPEKPEGFENFWLVDPLDGTREFLKRNGEFSVNIALIFDRKPVLGVITGPGQLSANPPNTASNLVSDLAYTASIKTAAKKRQAGNWTELPTLAKTPIPDAPVILGPQTLENPHLKLWQAQHYPNATWLRVGSALKFGVLAEGRAHLYPRFGPTMEWDTAAGHAILQAVGGDIKTFDGPSLTYAKANYLNPHFIAKI
ncbi:MAG: 3'(2'),5'-bisphosphate nucleotidase CysQ [Alphaproteobacteria bacterium]|nr:3'(2'),5'-bisphosphate nucleotidase CysQ [Alphaproteobacteria bacterium]